MCTIGTLAATWLDRLGRPRAVSVFRAWHRPRAPVHYGVPPTCVIWQHLAAVGGKTCRSTGESTHCWPVVTEAGAAVSSTGTCWGEKRNYERCTKTDQHRTNCIQLSSNERKFSRVYKLITREKYTKSAGASPTGGGGSRGSRPPHFLKPRGSTPAEISIFQ